MGCLRTGVRERLFWLLLGLLSLAVVAAWGCSSGDGPDFDPPTGRVIVPTETPAVVPETAAPLEKPAGLEATAVPTAVVEPVEEMGPVVVQQEGTMEPAVPTSAPVVLPTPTDVARSGPPVLDLSRIVVPDVMVQSEGGVSSTKSAGAYLGVFPAPGLPPEAGGLANPNDKLLPLMYFEGYGVNPFIDADEDPLSTFALDGDTGSFDIAKLYLGEGALPEPDSVRVEEWVNSFDQGYGPVDSGRRATGSCVSGLRRRTCRRSGTR